MPVKRKPRQWGTYYDNIAQKRLPGPEDSPRNEAVRKMARYRMANATGDKSFLNQALSSVTGETRRRNQRQDTRPRRRRIRGGRR